MPAAANSTSSWSGLDRIARSVKHFLEVLDEFNRLNIEFISFREQIDTGGPLGRAIMVIVGAVAELERSLIIERVRAGMRRAKLEGRHIGRKHWCSIEPPSSAAGTTARAWASWRRRHWSAERPSTGARERIPAVTKGLEKPAA